MLCLSSFSSLKVKIRGESTHYTPKGDVDYIEPSLAVQFVRGGSIPEWARGEALAKLSWRGLPREVEPGQRIGWLDTQMAAQENGWDAATVALVEAELTRRATNEPGLFIIVEEPKVEAPYQRYDEHRRVHGQRKLEHAIKDIVAAYESVGFDVEQAVAYERQNGNDQQVIDALQALSAPVEGEDTEPLVAA